MCISKWQNQPVGFGSTFTFCSYTSALGADANFGIFVQLCVDRSLYCETALFSFWIRCALVLPALSINLCSFIELLQKNISSGRRVAVVLLLGWQSFKSQHLINIQLQFCFDQQWHMAKAGPGINSILNFGKYISTEAKQTVQYQLGNLHCI